MKRTRSVFLAFVLALVLALLLAASALAVPPLDGSGGARDPDTPNPLAVKELRNHIAPGNAQPGGGAWVRRAPQTGPRPHHPRRVRRRRHHRRRHL